MKHYTYKITQPLTGFYYIGVRSCEGEPINDNYKGSMISWKLTKEEKSLCIKEIIAQYDTREEANEDEEFMINQIKKDWKDSNCKNGNSGKGKFCTLGLSHTEETKQKMSISQKGKPSPHKGKKRKPLSEEHKAKLSAMFKGRAQTKEHIQNSVLAKKAKKESKNGKEITNL
jgi:hypothetical protein